MDNISSNAGSRKDVGGTTGCRDLSVAQLAHELSNMLDGSMRCLTLARRALNPAGQADDAPSVDQALNKLRTAQDTMRSMAEMLERAMVAPQPPVEFYDSPRNLGQTAAQVVERLADFAEANDVTLRIEVTPEAADLPAGPLEPVIVNGLRNAIESCAAGRDGSIRQVELSINVTAGSELTVLFSDTGAGVPADFSPGRSGRADGHGVGLELVHQIVVSLGGSVSLTNVPFSSGAVLQVRVPLRSLASK